MISEKIIAVLNAHKELKECQDSCEVDAGYFCYDQSEKLKSACDDLDNYIIGLIDKALVQ